MPSPTPRKEAQILDYFRTTDLTVAIAIAGLVADTVKERKAKSDEARARAFQGQRATAVATSKPAAGKKKSAKGGKKGGPKRAPAVESTSDVDDQD